MKNEQEQHPKVVVKKVIHATREKVFDAWTKPELMQQWFFPANWTAKTTNDLRVGGKYSHNMISNGTPSKCSPQGNSGEVECDHLHTGEYLEISPPEKLVFTWNSSAVKNTRVTVQLQDLGSSTEVIITHDLLETEDLRKRHTEGWEGCIANLSTFLS